MTFLTGTGAIGTKLFTFSDADRLPDSLRDRSGVGWSPTPHAPGLGAPQRALDRKLWHFVVETSGLRCILARCILCWKRRRRRRRRLHMYCTDPARPPRDLGTTNRQDSTDAPAMAASSVRARAALRARETPPPSRSARDPSAADDDATPPAPAAFADSSPEGSSGEAPATAACDAEAPSS